MKKYARIAFILIAVLLIIAEISGNRMLMYCSKPLLMPVLAVWFGAHTNINTKSFLRSAILGGLFFSTLGDILLMFASGDHGQPFFIFGLLSFLITHLFYATGFVSSHHNLPGALRQQPLLVLPFLGYLTGLLLWLWPGMPEGLQLPVSVYACVITVMALSATNLRSKIPAPIFRTILAGVLLFLLSDSLIAVNKFGAHFDGAGVAIISTYIAGQWLIASGAASILRNQASSGSVV